MIIITARGHEFGYIGDIEINIDEVFVKISAYCAIGGENQLNTWDRQVFDIFHLVDVESIVGIES